MAIRSIGAKLALQQNIQDWADVAESTDKADSTSKFGSEGQVIRSLHRVRRWAVAGCLGLMVCGSSGCTTTSGVVRSFGNSHCIDDFMIGFRNSALAEKAWHCQKERFGNQPYAKEFKDGFVQGYIEVAQGGNGCTPAIAPSQYWGWKYQSTHGHAAVSAWFAGYPMGARAAEQDGVGHWGQLRTAGPAAPAVIDQVPVANPFDSEPEMIPLPKHFDSPEAADTADEMDSAFNQALEQFPPATEPNWDHNKLIQQHQSTVKAKMSGGSPRSSDAAEVHIDDFLDDISEPVHATDADARELPFSFE